MSAWPIPPDPDCEHTDLDVQLRCRFCARDFSAYEDALVQMELDMVREYNDLPDEMKVECRTVVMEGAGTAVICSAPESADAA